MKQIGVDLGGTKLSVGIIEKNTILKIKKEHIDPKLSKEKIIGQITNLIDDLLQGEVQGVQAEVSSIGVGVPGITKDGFVTSLGNIPDFKDVDLALILKKKYNVPVYIANDANCFALAEYKFGKAKNKNPAIGIILGTGVGSGIIINGKLCSGHNGGAGEWGDIHLKDHDVEYYCSGKFFQKEYLQKGEEFFVKAKQGDKKALEIFENFGENLACALEILIRTLDPEIIVFGGSVAKTFPFFESSMKQALKQKIPKKNF